jgi:hypothetical protein
VILHSKEIGRLADNIIRTFAVPPSENSGRFADNTRRLFTKRLTVLTSQEKIAVRAFVEAFKELEPYAIGKL